MKYAFLIFAMLMLMAPVAAWEKYKPIRVVAPEWVENISCVTPEICLEDESKYPEASRLYENALRFVGKEVGSFKKHPRLVFCSTEACVRSFGLKSTALTIGGWGIIIGPGGWLDYYVRHEMFHHRQVEELGLLAHWLNPDWFNEGMAYSLSGDPRRPLTEPWQNHRTKFEAWNHTVGKEHLWEAAAKL